MPSGLFSRCSIKLFRLFTAAAVGSKPCMYWISTITFWNLSAESRSWELEPTDCLFKTPFLLKLPGFASSSLEQETAKKNGKNSKGSSFRKLRKFGSFFIKWKLEFTRGGDAVQKTYV